MSNIGQGSNESTLDQEAALIKKQKKTVSQGVNGSVAAQAGVVSPESAIAVKKLRRKPVADDALQGDAALESGAVVSDVDASALNDGGTWQLAQAETAAVVPGLGGAGAAAAGAGSAAAGAAGAGAAMGAGAAAAAGLGLGTVAAAAAGVAGVAAAAGGKSSSPAPAAPPAPTIAVVSGDDRVSSSENTNGVTISGTTVAGATVKIYDGETLLATVVADGGGAYSLSNVHFAASAGATHNLTATATTSTGESARTSIHAVQVDTVAPTGITGAIVHNSTYDTGSSASDNLTNHTQPQIEGVVEANASVRVVVGVQTLTAAADANGHFVVTPAALTAGTYTPVITVTDAAGNSTTANGTPFTVDTSGPAAPAASISHDALNDTGASASDNITSNTTPLIVGTAEAGSAVRVVVGAQTLNTVADVNGNFSVTPTALAAGSYTPVITATDAAGNSTTADGTAFVVGVALGAPTISTVAGNDLVNASENAAGVSVSGTAAALSTVKVYDGATLLGTTTADGSGHYTLNLATNSFSASAGATHSLTATATNNVGTSASSAVRAIQVDTVAPTGISGSIAHNGTDDSGASATDNVTGNNRPWIEGHVEANASVSVLVGSQTLTATADGSGYFHVRPATGLADGSHTPAITVTDAAGNSSTANGTPFTVNTAIPAAATGVSILHDLTNDTGASSSDSITNNTTPAIVGNAQAGATVTVSIGSGGSAQTLTTTADSYGHFSVTPTTLVAGTYTPKVTVMDSSGNVSSRVDGTPFTVDVTAPTAPDGAIAHTVPNDTGLSHSDDLTSVATPVISVTAEAGAHVTVAVGGQTLTATETTPGNFSVTTGPLVSGTYTPVITAVDAAGNSTSHNGHPFTVDTIAPNAPTGHIAHDETNDTGVSQGDSITLNTAPEIVGQAEAHARVSVVVDGVEYATTADQNGAYSITVDGPLQSGSYTPVITVTDNAGNSTTANGTEFIVEALPAATMANAVATNHTLEHPTALIHGTSDVDVCADGGLTVIFEGQTYTQGGLHLIVDEQGNWTLDVSAQVLTQGLADGHYDVTAVATNAAGGETTTTMTDVLWLLDGCQNFVAGDMDTNDNHWSISGEPGAETLGVDFGLFVTSLGGIEVTSYVESDFNFDAQDVTLADCGIDVTHGSATLHTNNITLDGGNITVTDTAVRHSDYSQELDAGITLDANGAIVMLGYGSTGGIGPMTQNSGNGGLITLNETNAGWNGQFGGADVNASNAGIYLNANDIAITVDGHTTAGVTLSQNYIGQGEDSNVYANNAHIDLLAGGVSLLETYTDVMESGTYTLDDNGITRFETAQSTVYGEVGLSVELLQDHLVANNLLDASNASVSLDAGWIGAGSVLIDQETLVGASVDLSNAHIDVFGQGVSLIDNFVTSFSDVTGYGSYESHHSSHFEAASVMIVQHSITAYDGSIDASNAQDAVGGWFVAGGDVVVEQTDLHASQGIDISGAQARVGAAPFMEGADAAGGYFDLGSSQLSNDYTLYGVNGDSFETASWVETFVASEVHIRQAEITAGSGDINAADAYAVRNVSFQGSFLAPLQGDVFVDQYDITANQGSVTISNAHASNSVQEQSYWFGNSSDIGVFSYASLSDTTVHDYTVYSAFANESYDATHSEVWGSGQVVAVNQHGIKAGWGDIVANGANASLGIDHSWANGNNGFGPTVFGGDVTVAQTYLTAEQGDLGSVDLNNAHAELWSQENVVLVHSTVTADVNYHDVAVQTVGGVNSGNFDSQTHDYTYHTDAVVYGGVHVEQDNIYANGSINAVDAAVSINVGGLYSGDLYISQDYMQAGGNINLQGAHLTVNAANDITLVNEVNSLWEHTADSSTVFGNAPATSDATLQQYHNTQVGSAYIEQYGLNAELGNVTVSDATLAMHAGGSISAQGVWVEQSQINAIEGSIEASGATVNLSVGDYAVLSLDNSADVYQNSIYAASGHIGAGGANITLAAGANSLITADNVYVTQNSVSAGNGVDLFDAHAVVSAGDGAYIDVQGAVYVDQTYITSGGYLDAHGAQVGVTVGSDADHHAEIYTDGAAVYQQGLTAGAGMDIGQAGVNMQGGNGASIYVDGLVYVSQAENYVGGGYGLNAAGAHVTAAAGDHSDITAAAAFIDQHAMAGGYTDISAASVEVSVGSDSRVSLYDNAFIEQYGIRATYGDVSATGVNITLAAGNNSEIVADNVLVTQTDITASDSIELWDVRAVVSAGDGGYVDVPGAVFVQQNYISAGGHLDATGAQVGITVGSDNNNGASIYTDGAYVIQQHFTANDWIDSDNAGVNLMGGDGARIEINGNAYLQQQSIYANGGELYGAYGHVTVTGGNDSFVTANAAYIYQNDLTGSWLDISAASVEVRVGDDSQIALGGNAYIEQSWISAFDGGLRATGVNVTLAAGMNSEIAASNVFVTQTEVTASWGGVDMWDVSAVVSAGDGGYVNVAGAVFVDQNYISAGGGYTGGYLDATGAQVGITVGSDNNNGASIYTDGAYVTQHHFTASDWIDIDQAGVNVQGGNGARIEIDGSVYLQQQYIYANEYNREWGGLRASYGRVSVAAGDNSLVTADEVYILQNNLTGNWADVHGASVEVTVGDNAQIDLNGSAYIEQSWISAYERNNGWSNYISASNVNVALLAGLNSTLYADYVYVSQTEITAGDYIDMANAQVTVSAGDGGYVDVPGAISVEQFHVQSQRGDINASGAQVFVAVGSDTNGYGASIYTDGAYISQQYIYAHDAINVGGSGVNVQGGDGADVEIDGSAFVVQRDINANYDNSGWGGLTASNVYVTLAAGNDAYVTANNAYIDQNNVYSKSVDVAAASVAVLVADGSEINLDTGAYIHQGSLFARYGDVQGQDASVRITGGNQSLITIDSTVVHDNHPGSWVNWSNGGGAAYPWHSPYGFGDSTAWNDTNTRYNDASVYIDQQFISASGSVDLSGASLVVGVDAINPNSQSLPVGLTVDLSGVSVEIVQNSIFASGSDLNLDSARVNLQVGDQGTISVSGQTTQEGTDNYISYSDAWGWSNGGYDAYLTYVTSEDITNTHAEFNTIGVLQFGDLYGADNVFVNDAAVRIAAGDQSFITLDATSVLVEQSALTAAGGDVQATAASVMIDIGSSSQLHITPERDGYSHDNMLYTVSEWVDWGHWHDFFHEFTENRTSNTNSYGDVAVWQNHVTAAWSVDVDGANVQISEANDSGMTLTGITVDVQQAYLSASSGDVSARNAVVNIDAGNYSGVTLLAAVDENLVMSADYVWGNASNGNYALNGFGTLTHVLSEQVFDVKVTQEYLTASNGDVNAGGAAVNFSVGDHSQISLQGADVYVEQYELWADGGDVIVSGSNVDMSAGANSRIQVSHGTQNVYEQHETGWFQPWSNESFVTSYTYAGDVSVDQSYIYAQERLTGNAHEVTTGGNAYLNDVSVHLSVGDAVNSWGGWISAHNVNVTQEYVTADENLYATNVGVSVLAGNNAFVEIHNADVIQDNITAGGVLRTKLVGDYFSGNLTNDNGNSDLGVAYWGALDLSGAYVNLSAGSDITAHEAIVSQTNLTAGETLNLSSASIDVAGTYVTVDQVVLAQSDISVGGVQYYYQIVDANHDGIEDRSRYQLDQLNTLTVVNPLEFTPTTILGLVDLSDASIQVTADWNFRSDVVAIERNAIESGQLVDMHSNRIDVSASDMTIGDVHNWLGVDGYYSDGNYGNLVDGASAATFDFNNNSIWLSAWSGDISVNNFVDEYRFVTASVIDSDNNYIGLTATGNIDVGRYLGIGNEVVAANFDVPVEVNMSSNAIDVIARGNVHLSNVYIGAGADGGTTMALTMDDNSVYISAHSVYANSIENVNFSGASLAAGSSVNHNSLEVYANDRSGDIGFNDVYLSGTDASSDMWGNNISIGSMSVENMDQSHITFGAEYLTLFADSDMTIGLLDLSSQDVAGYSYPSKDNWWWAEATIASDSTLNISDLKLDGAQAFLEFNADAGSRVHYDIMVDQLGIGQNNGDLSYRNHSGSSMLQFANPSDHMTHDNSEQYDLIDLSGLGITSVDQLTWSVTLDSGFATGLVRDIHFELKPGATHLPNGNTDLLNGSSVVFDLQNVRLDSSARHDYYGDTGQGTNGVVDSTDVWYAFWNYSLHLAPAGG